MRVLLFFICLFLATPNFAQDVDANRARNSLSLGYSGISRTLGIRFDHLFALREKTALTFNIGVPIYSRYSNRFLTEVHGLGASAGIGLVYGKKNVLANVELNYGFNEGPYLGEDPTVHRHAFGVFLGGRFQHREGGLFLKFGVTPTVMVAGEDVSLPLPGIHLEIGGTPRRNPYEKFSEKHPGFHPGHAAPKRINRLYLTAFVGDMAGKLKPYRNPARPSGNEVVGYLNSSVGYGTISSFRIARLGMQAEWKFLPWMAVSGGAYFGNETHEFDYLLVERPSYTNHVGEMAYDITSLYLPLHLHFDIGRRYVLGFQMGPYYTQILGYQAVGTFDGDSLSSSNLAELSSPANGLAPQSTFGFSMGMRMRIPIQERFHFTYALGLGINRSPLFSEFRVGTQWTNMELGLGVNLF